MSHSPSVETNNHRVGRPNLSQLNPKDRFAVLCSWFLGPRAENRHTLSRGFDMVVDQIVKGRKNYFADEPTSIGLDTIKNPYAEQSVEYLNALLKDLAKQLAEHSAPFFSPRYAGHMTSDITLPASLGYLIGMLYNQNNVAPEGGPLTTQLEYYVGQELCNMLGFVPEEQSREPHLKVTPWCHITCGGSVSNLESMWIGSARNLKYYPLALKRAMERGNPLEFAASLMIEVCDGTKKPFGDCTTWELLNLQPTQILNLPNLLRSDFNIPVETLDTILKDYSIQTVGKSELDRVFEITKSPQYLMSGVTHYSWSKSASLTGIGSGNIIQVKVDLDARMDVEHLRECLNNQLANQQAVYAVVVLAGSTEHGAVDPIEEVLELRKQFQKRGLSFMIHADAAWGGYFVTKVHPTDTVGSHVAPPCSLPHSVYTNNQLLQLRHVDSATVDPHKSGYVPFPGGAICYRDGRLRYLSTWKSPVLNIDQPDKAVGIYGIAGSKPGASATAIWLSHKVIGLDKDGYGTLLGTALFTGAMMYMHIATMSLDHENLIVVPMTMLQSEKGDDEAEIRKEKERILRFLTLSNDELEENKDDLAELGSDLVINAFACNFYIDGVPNKDVVECNYLNRALYNKLSIRTPGDDLHKRPLILYSTTFQQKTYGECLTRFKTRLGLDENDDEDLVALSNTSMSPFPTSTALMQKIVGAFKDMAEKEVASIVKYRYPRWKIYRCIHAFLLQGTDQLYLVHFPVFNVANHRQQIIATAEISELVMAVYRQAFVQNPHEPLVVFTVGGETLEETLERGSFKGAIYQGSPFRYLYIRNLKVVKQRSLSRCNMEKQYPVHMPFYLYGTADQQHIDHVLLRAPNIQLSASHVKIRELGLSSKDPRWVLGLAKGLVAVMKEVHESVIQPLTKGNEPEFFKAGRTFKVRIYECPPTQNGNLGSERNPTSETMENQHNSDNYETRSGTPESRTQFERSLKFLTTAELTLTDSVWLDYGNLNRDIGPAELHNHGKEYVAFQMRGEVEWRNAYHEECKSVDATSDFS
ncbi:PLP-dependent transferase [Serendipita vermifera]|nr:PLP-dependent transferase [Serendipita vermifera]